MRDNFWSDIRILALYQNLRYSTLTWYRGEEKTNQIRQWIKDADQSKVEAEFQAKVRGRVAAETSVWQRQIAC